MHIVFIAQTINRDMQSDFSKQLDITNDLKILSYHYYNRNSEMSQEIGAIPTFFKLEED